MLAIRLASVMTRAWTFSPGLLSSLLLTSCQLNTQSPAPISVQLYQRWELQPGDTIAGYTVMGGLGDTSIALNGNPVYAPFNGETQQDKRQCVFFSSPDVPAYLFRFCGLEHPRLGNVSQGEPLGKAAIVQFATLRKQPNGTWAIVEPSKRILERTLKPS